ncbi:MAG: class III cytochrome c [Candidatus Electrothrix sp. AR4]|nr:class III cytochrome c [Candidatus Electrothrix sp. AR4]
MKKALIFGLALAFVCSAGFISLSTAEEDKDKKNGPEHVEITDGTDKPMKPAYFPHRAHQERLKDCGICHHGKDKDGKQTAYKKGKTKPSKCSTCHNKNADGISLDGVVPGMSPIQRAGHARCQGCHKESKSTKTPPVQLMSCMTCHTKPKPAE